MKLIKWIRRDGLLHIETSFLLCAVFNLFMPVWLTVLLAFVLGIGWEIIGKRFGGVANWHDVLCDLIGVALGVLYCVIHYLVFLR